jgi:hypothetical protein
MGEAQKKSALIGWGSAVRKERSHGAAARWTELDSIRTWLEEEGNLR